MAIVIPPLIKMQSYLVCYDPTAFSCNVTAMQYSARRMAFWLYIGCDNDISQER